MGKKQESIQAYIQKIYELRYFLVHLVKLDLRNKFRRSKLGILWTFLSPLILTIIMSVIFSVAFHIELAEYAPYILTGILFWDIFAGSFQAGGYAIISNQYYIRQCNHPYSFYTLKSALVYIITFLISLVSLLAWLIFVNPVGILYGIMYLVPAMIIYFLMSWAGTTIAAYVCAKYRDYPMMAPLILQALWYVSPVFMQESIFQDNPYLLWWFNANPTTHLLHLIRKPFLYNYAPSMQNYGVSILFVVILGFFAWWISKRMGKEVIFYL